MKDYKKLIEDIYIKYYPAKVNSVPKLLDKYKGLEEELLLKIYEKYNIVNSEKSEPVQLKNYQNILEAFYAVHCPAKVNSVPKLLEKYKGLEEVLLLGVYEKYNVTLSGKISTTTKNNFKITVENVNKPNNPERINDVPISLNNNKISEENVLLANQEKYKTSIQEVGDIISESPANQNKASNEKKNLNIKYYIFSLLFLIIVAILFIYLKKTSLSSTESQSISDSTSVGDSIAKIPLNAVSTEIFTLISGACSDDGCSFIFKNTAGRDIYVSQLPANAVEFSDSEGLGTKVQEKYLNKKYLIKYEMKNVHHEASNSDNIEMVISEMKMVAKPEDNNTIAISERAYFYKEADPSTKEKTYIIKGQQVKFNQINGDFIYASFTNDQGTETLGWMLKSDFNLAKSESNLLSSSNDFEKLTLTEAPCENGNCLFIFKNVNGNEFEASGLPKNNVIIFEKGTDGKNKVKTSLINKQYQVKYKRMGEYDNAIEVLEIKDDNDTPNQTNSSNITQTKNIGSTIEPKGTWVVLLGSFKSIDNAKTLIKKCKTNNIDVTLLNTNDFEKLNKDCYFVCAGKELSENNAKKIVDNIKSKGFDVFAKDAGIYKTTQQKN